VGSEKPEDKALITMVRLPMGLDKQNDKELITAVANYVLAEVLNRGMSRGFRSCDIGIAGLTAHGGGGDPDDRTAAGPVAPGSSGSRAVPARDSRLMTGADWDKKIREVATGNAYEVLADRFLRDFNTERKSFQFIDRPAPTTLWAVSISDL